MGLYGYLIMEKILEIKEVHIGNEGAWDGYMGYLIITDEQEIELTISAGQCCCERTGYFMSEDNTEDYVGANLLGLEITDIALNEAKMIEESLGGLNDKDSYFEGGVMFVDIKTDKGVLQFVAYNEHNGYYGHDAKIVSTFLEHTETL